MSDRYYAKREAGLSPVRSDGSHTSPETDRQAAAAEQFAAERLGATYNGDVYATHGDNGHDFTVDGRTVEVIWMGYRSGAHEPRYRGNVIVNPHEPHRHADLYVMVAGSIARGFSLLGCCLHTDLVFGADFGFGPRLALHTDKLRPFKMDTP
jgi:hypothetical protein